MPGVTSGKSACDVHDKRDGVNRRISKKKLPGRVGPLLTRPRKLAAQAPVKSREKSPYFNGDETRPCRTPTDAAAQMSRAAPVRTPKSPYFYYKATLALRREFTTWTESVHVQCPDLHAYKSH